MGKKETWENKMAYEVFIYIEQFIESSKGVFSSPVTTPIGKDVKKIAIIKGPCASRKAKRIGSIYISGVIFPCIRIGKVVRQ